MPNYINATQQRLMRVITALAGHEVHGLTPKDIATQADASASQITADMANLVAFGWAERVPDTDRWRLSPKPIQLALRHMQAMDLARSRLEETSNRYSRT